jgi:hypothetical protein
MESDLIVPRLPSISRALSIKLYGGQALGFMLIISTAPKRMSITSAEKDMNENT